MNKTILVTGSTDGIGFETARMLASSGHAVLLHGRNRDKLKQAEHAIAAIAGHRNVESFLADLSRVAEVEALVRAVAKKHARLDVLINNAGLYHVPEPMTADGLDARFVVNTIAPYLLTQGLSPLLGKTGRVINLASAAQAPVDARALNGQVRLSESAAYAQSKLALIMWSSSLARARAEQGPAIVAVNPGSMLGTKMVREAYGVDGGDLRIGAEILVRAALDETFAKASGRYFDNDSRRFAPPHPDALDPHKCDEVLRSIEKILVTEPGLACPQAAPSASGSGPKKPSTRSTRP